MNVCMRVIGALMTCAVMSTVALEARGPASGTQEQKPAAAANALTPLNLNQATAVDLQRLPGIGPAMANRIVEYRQKNGGFKKIEELMNVQGIGEKNFLKLRTLVSIGPVRTAER